MKQWHKKDEWKSYANCGGVPDHTLPEARDDGGPVADVDLVEYLCHTCPVRPECAKWAVEDEAHGVWVCGRYIPGHDEDKRRARKVREELAESIPEELERRGSDF